MKTGFYEARLAPIISDLSQVVVSLGLISVSLGYVTAVIADSSLLYSGAFWLRLVLLLSTVSFTCYSLLGYVADMDADADTGWAASCRSPSRIIILFLIDLAMLGEQGWMYGVLLVTDISDLGEAGTLQPFSFQTVHFVLLALLAAAWHGTTFIWHLVAGSRMPGQLSHLYFLLAFVGLALLAAGWQPDDLFSQWIWVLGYTAVVLVLFFTRGRKLVGRVLDSYRQEQTATGLK